MQEINKNEGMITLRNLIVDYIKTQMPAFYDEVCVIIELEVVKACKEILRGEISNNIIKERSMYYVKQQIPKKLYDIACTPQSSIAGKLEAMICVDEAIEEAVRIGVDKTIEKFHKMYEE